jgi:hypothetical protein
VDKYPSGTKVRIKAGRGFHEPYSDIWQYENLTGEIVNSTGVAWNQIRSWERDSHAPSEVVQAYKIHMDNGIEADNVIEECLELWKAPAWSAKPSGSEEAGAQETHYSHSRVQGVVWSNA